MKFQPYDFEIWMWPCGIKCSLPSLWGARDPHLHPSLRGLRLPPPGSKALGQGTNQNKRPNKVQFPIFLAKKNQTAVFLEAKQQLKIPWIWWWILLVLLETIYGCFECFRFASPSLSRRMDLLSFWMVLLLVSISPMEKKQNSKMLEFFHGKIGAIYQRKFRNLTSDYTESCCWRSVNQEMWSRRCDTAEMCDIRIWRVGSARNAVFYHSFVASPARKVRS